MTEAFICDAVRTPRGKASPKGGLFDYTPTQLLIRLHEEIRARSGLDPGAIDDVIIGCASQNDEQGANIAKTSALLGGWGDNVPGLTVNRFCASGIEAVNLAAARIKSDGAGVLLAGGVESISHVPMYSDNGPLFCDPATVEAIGSVEMGIAADIVATIEGFERPELDAFGVSTQIKAAAAWSQQRFARSVVPMERHGREPFAYDEHIRADTTYEALAAQQPLFAEIGLSGQDDRARSRLRDLGEIRHVHTRGTSPSLADAAGLLVIASGEAAAEFGLRPRARIVASQSACVDPVTMLTAGQLAVEQLLARQGLHPDDIDVFEFAEAFAALCLRFQRDLGVDDDRFNPNGGTIAMGHSFGATGAILTMGLVDELERRRARRGVIAVSGAAGLGCAALVELVDA